MTREEVDKIVNIITEKVENNETLTDFEDLVYDEIKLSQKENREIPIRLIEDFKFWMD